MQSFTLNYDLNDPELGFKNFKEVYRHFLSFEHVTTQKILWREQKKIYDEIFNAPNPKEAYEKFRKLNKTTHQVASERMAARGGMA